MVIQLESISKSYDNMDGSSSQHILTNVSLNIDENQAIAITGPSGSGKTTLLNILGTLDTPDSGIIRMNQDDISEYKNKQLAELRNLRIGFVFQSHHLLPQLNVLENILLPTIPLKDKALKKGSEKRALDFLGKVGLLDKTYNKPGQLSGGECQRVAVVRALINKPDVILADEPTGSLDEKSAEQIGNLLSQIQKEEKIALVVVTHSAELAQKMDCIYTLSNGALNLIEN